MKALMSSGKQLSDELSKVCVLFDPKDGRVVHVHGATTLRSGQGLSATEMETRAIRHAEHFGKETRGLRALHVPISVLRDHAGIRVNERGDGLVTVPRKARPKRKF